MTKKAESKAKVKGADTEQKVLKKIKDGDKAAKDARKKASDKPDKSVKAEKFDKSEKSKSKSKDKDVSKKGAADKSTKSDKFVKRDKSTKSDQYISGEKGEKKTEMTGKRTHAEKDGSKAVEKSGKAGDKTQQPILNRRQKQRVSDLIKKLRVSSPSIPFHIDVSKRIMITN